MFKLLLKSLFASLLFTTALHAALTPPPLPPELGPEGGRFNKLHVLKVERMINSHLEEKNLSEDERSEEEQLKNLLALGKKASQWIEIVNQTRSEDTKLDLSNPKKTGGIPMTAPQKSSTEIMIKRYADFLSSTSPLITSVIEGHDTMTSTPPVSDEEFLKSLRVLDRIYQSTIRWAGSRAWLAWYANRAIFDVRGYLFLQQTPELESTLKTFNTTMSAEDKTKFSGWLLGLCRNGDFEVADCQKELKTAISKARLFDYYNRFSKYGKKMYDLFFTIKKIRPEIKWNEAKTELIAPFQTPERADVKKWLKENIEDEWKSPEFQLVISYKNATPGSIPSIEFKEGVTAHVNELGGNLITMEAEYPIESIDQKWTIRHEYGHVLGFSDCYLEFYDTLEKAMIYYETDVDNLMCSRNGHLKPTHIEQLYKMYK